MANSQMSEVIQYLRRTTLLRDGAGLTDGQLLEDYISRRDDAAVAALVRRHGPMVWGVCRRIVGHHDAEDAFQATFLVLVRKAASIASRELLANWLYGVARQTALKARATIAKRKVREKQVMETPEPAVIEQDLGNDLRPLLDQELSRLPDNYRVVIVLCDLEGKTRKETARQLGLPEGTVASRLARARAMLAKRLTRHGLAAPEWALATMLSQNVAAPAGVPTSVLSSTIKAASLFAAGQTAARGMISAKVAALTEGVIKTMWLTKLKIVTVLLAAAALSGAAGLIFQTQAAEQPKAPAAAEKDQKPKADKAKDEEKLLIDGWMLVAKEQDGKRQEYPQGIGVTLNLTDGEFQLLVPTINPLSRGGFSDLSYYHYKLDPKQKPKAIDLVTADGEHKPWLRGIYKLEGDRLTICWGEKETKRPTDYTAKPDSGRTLNVYKRAFRIKEVGERKTEDQGRTGTAGDGNAAVNAAPEKTKIYTPEEAMRAAFGDKSMTVRFQVQLVQGTIGVKSGDKEESSWTLGHGPGDVGLYPLHGLDDTQNQFSVVLTAKAKKQLDRLGIHDVGKHFMEKTIRVTGRISIGSYTSESMTGRHYELIVDDISQFEAVD
jgi:RNA polymerase sigma factor (sigma-70 family)